MDCTAVTMIGESDHEIPKHQTVTSVTLSAKYLGSRHCPGEEDESGHRLGPILHVCAAGWRCRQEHPPPPSNPGDFMGLQDSLRYNYSY